MSRGEWGRNQLIFDKFWMRLFRMTQNIYYGIKEALPEVVSRHWGKRCVTNVTDETIFFRLIPVLTFVCCRSLLSLR